MSLRLLGRQVTVTISVLAFALSGTSYADNCFSKPELDKIAEGLRDLDYCKFDLKEARGFIHEMGSSPTEAAVDWWQEPEWILGGIVVSFSVGATLGYLAAK